MLESLLGALEAGLSLWGAKEKTKYQDRLIELKRAYYEETNRSDSDRSDAVLDNIEHELRILADSFAASVGKQNA